MDSPLSGFDREPGDEPLALVMCGGKGSRLRPAVGETEKPLVTVGDLPLIDRVVDAVTASSAPAVFAAVSPVTPETAAHLRQHGEVQCIDTAGDGYVDDLMTVLGQIGAPVVTVTADLPFLSAAHVNRAIDVAAGDSLTVCVPHELTRRVGVSAETTMQHEDRTVVPTGLNVVGDAAGDGADRTVVWIDERLGFNINRPADLRAARKWHRLQQS